MRKYIALVLGLVLMLASASCYQWNDVDETNLKNRVVTGDNPSGQVSDGLPVMKVAVVLPRDISYGPRFERVAEWARQNIAKGTSGIPFPPAPEDMRGIRLEIDWIDENTIDDIKATASELANRSDIMCIIGPMFSSNAYYMGLECAKTGMNMLLPCTTSSEVVRKFSSKPFFWSFAETDIRQCQVILETAKQHLGAKSVSLLAGTSFYGQTFINWLPFEAHEYGLDLKNIYTFDDVLTSSLAEKVLSESEEDQVIVCVPGDTPDIVVMQDAVLKVQPKGKVIFSDIAMDPSLLDMSTTFEGAMGIGITADEESHFMEDYVRKYGQEPTEGECQYYDALVLMSLVAADLFNQNIKDPTTEKFNHISDPGFYNTKVSEALERILEPEDFVEQFLTDPEDINTAITISNVRGASGHLDFKKSGKSTVAHSTYQLWTIQDNKFHTLATFKETPISTDEWDKVASKVDDIATSDVDIEYPELYGQWAVLVAGSDGWVNYRHQANVLNMYRTLKSHGYPDDHIILIMEDDLAFNDNNIYRGQVVTSDGVNLYENVTVDYILSRFTVSDFKDIMLGRKSNRLPEVILPGPNDNVFVYWTGNGSMGHLELGSNKFKASDFKGLMSSMSSDGRGFRKMLWLVDASNAQSVVNVSDADDFPGLLCINSSAASETSLSDQTNFDEQMETYLSTHFTSVFVDEFGKWSNMTYYQLYETLARYTSGSHVNVSNADKFDNLKKGTISEFIQYYY